MDVVGVEDCRHFTVTLGAGQNREIGDITGHAEHCVAVAEAMAFKLPETCLDNDGSAA